MKRVLKAGGALFSRSQSFVKKSSCHFRTIFEQFHESRSGNVAMMFGLALVPLVTAAGMTIDYASALKTRTAMASALDAAALAAGRTLQITGSETEAGTTAKNHFNNLMANANLTANIKVTKIDGSQGVIQLAADAAVNTSFLGVIGYNKIDVAVTNEAKLKVGGNGDKYVEISMMLDITGSMSGSKIASLKKASKDLVQIVLQGNTASLTTTRIALAPFSQTVNVGSYADAVRGTLPATKTIGSGASAKTYKLAPTCVSERQGSEAYTDVAPEPGKYVGPIYTTDGSCEPSAKLIPLTSDKVTLDNAINNFWTNGYTAGHLGTAWAWYTLSPKWSGIWPASSAPAAYSDTKTQKIAVLMTDGEYNTQYDLNGIKGTSPNGDSTYQARELCKSMKNEGITVYTVGFQLGGGPAVTTLKNCATSTSHFFLAENDEQLLQAFREIAFQIAQLRLTK